MFCRAVTPLSMRFSKDVDSASIPGWITANPACLNATTFDNERLAFCS